MPGIIQKYKDYTEYLPIVLLGLIFITENELEKHALRTSCQISITIVTIIVYFTIAINFPKARIVALITAIALWVLLIYVKRQYVPK